jgi:predicted transporter
MVNLTEKMAKFRDLGLLQQSAAVGVAFFAAYWLYLHFVLGLDSSTAAADGLSAAVLFTAVYYLTSVIALRMRVQDQKLQHAKGPKRGRKNS